jgi:hypothetical protein
VLASFISRFPSGRETGCQGIEGRDEGSGVAAVHNH